MCGRYASSRNPDELVEVFEIDIDELPTPEAAPDATSDGSTDAGPGGGSGIVDYNVAPTTDVPVVLTRSDRGAEPDDEPRRRLRALRWGLVPSWAKDKSIGNRMINARAETLLETSAYKRAALARRCLVPADGWYEWQRSPTEKDAKGKPRKQPFFIRLANGPGLAFAGVYELWRDRSVHDDDPAVWLFSFSIVTTAAEPGLDVIHDRMPLVLDAEQWNDWLDPTLTDADGVRAMLQPHDPGRFAALAVSTRVNSVRNNGPELLRPAAPEDLVGVVDPATGELIGAGNRPLF